MQSEPQVRQTQAPNQGWLRRRWALGAIAGAFAAIGLVFLAPAFACSGGPSVGLSSSAWGEPGTPVTFTGSGFAPGNPVYVHWNALDGPVLAQAPANVNGSFSVNFNIPANIAQSGDYLLVATSSGSSPVAVAYHVEVPAPPGAVTGSGPIRDEDAPAPTSGSGSVSVGGNGATVNRTAAPDPVINLTAANADPAVATSPAGQSANSAGNQVTASPAANAAASGALPVPGGAIPGAVLAPSGASVGGLSVPAGSPASGATADARVAQGVQPSLSFAPGRASLGANKASAKASSGGQSLVAMMVAFAFALSVAGLLVSDELRRRKARARSRNTSKSTV